MLAIFLTISNENDRMTAIDLYNRYSRKMYAIALSMLKNESDAQDAVMEAFKRIIKNIKKFNNISCNKIEGLLVIYIRNTSIDVYNSNKRHAKYTSFECHSSDTQESTEDVVVSRNEAERLAEVIARLPESQSSALLMKYEYGYSYQDISKALNVTESAVRSMISRAKAELRKLMNAEEK